MSRQRRLTVFVLVVLAGVATVLISDWLMPPPLDRGEHVSVMVSDRNGRPLRAFPTREGRWRFAADLERIDPVFLEALLEVEDQRFYRHRGVDWIGMARAALSSASAGRIVSGGSTITMQTARLLEPRPRTIRSKLIEMVRAHQIETRLSKREILELYLTLAPYGGNLEGVRAASLAYFGRAPDRLTDDQIALLIALPQSPEARRPDLRPQGAMQGRARIAVKLARLGYFEEGRAQEAARAPLPSLRRNFPMKAWHGTQAALESGVREDFRSTLDSALQADIETLLASRMSAFDKDVQASVLVISIPGRAVRAHVGSVSRARAGGWLDLTAQARSPGSTLKPFIYAMAFDDGVATPATRMQDLPKRFASYQPENFDRSFRGDVSVAEALQHSLNVPAVLALDRVGPQRFASQLALAGATPRINGVAEMNPGLALALGGAGMTARELGLLYAALGDGGRAKPLVWRAGEEAASGASDGKRFMSADSAADILRILRNTPAPAGRMPGRLTERAPEIAFKTGTSYGYRDAWAAAIVGDLAIIAWVGRADGAPRPGATGRRDALPIVFEVADRAVERLGEDGEAFRRVVTEEMMPVRGAIGEFSSSEAAPEILFPPKNAELWAGALDGRPARAFVLSGRGQGELSWYVDGAPCETDDADAPVWRPEKAGFYVVRAVDAVGRASAVRVRVVGAPPN